MDLQTSLDLKGRVLWFDGDSSMSSERMAEMLLSGKSIEHVFPLEVDSSVKKYNLYTESNLNIKQEAIIPEPAFNIPEEFKTLNLKKFFYQKLKNIVEMEELSSDDIEKRISRVNLELSLFDQYEIVDLIKAIIYIVYKFESNNIVWGTGRGSSCACYCLYLAGLHEVDSVLYDLDLNEFFR